MASELRMSTDQCSGSSEKGQARTRHGWDVWQEEDHRTAEFTGGVIVGTPLTCRLACAG